MNQKKVMEDLENDQQYGTFKSRIFSELKHETIPVWSSVRGRFDDRHIEKSIRLCGYSQYNWLIKSVIGCHFPAAVKNYF